MGALVGVHRLQVDGVAQHVQLAGDAGAAVHVARDPGDLQGLAAVVALHHRDGFRHPGALVQQAAERQGALEAQRDVGLHVRQLLLHQLGGSQEATEQGALGDVFPAGVEAELRGAHGPPADAVARLVQTRERAAQSPHARQQVRLGYEGVRQADVAGDAGAQAQLVADLGGGEAVEVPLHDEAADVAVQLGPDHREVADRRVGDPVLGPVQDVAAVGRLGGRAHGGGVGAALRLGQAEAADQLAPRHLGQEAHLLRLRPQGVDGVHGEAGLHAHGRAVAAVDRLHLPRDQAVGDVAGARAAVLLGKRGAQEAELAHLGHDLAVEPLFGEGGHHARQQPLAGVGARRLADHPLLVGQPRREVQRIVPAVGLGRRGPQLV